jgi:hypothetical protein
MALPYKPQRTFTGTVGTASTGANGPEAIKTDEDEIVAMFDPLATHGDGTPGGIAKGNLATNGGILTEDDNVILEDANGDLTVTRDVIAGRNFVGPVVGDVTGDASLCVRIDGTRALTGNWDVGNFAITAKNYVSDVATGSQPYACTSTTKNTNLNADKVDGYDAGNSSGQIPVSNGTVCTNLNAEKWGGFSLTRTANGTTTVSANSTVTVTASNVGQSLFVQFAPTAAGAKVNYKIRFSGSVMQIEFSESGGVTTNVIYDVFNIS